MKVAKFFKIIKSHRLLILGIVSFQLNLGCATNGKTIVAGMSAGAVAGAGIGSEFYYEGEQSVRTRNAIIGAGIGALIVGGFLSWHYRAVERELEKVSGRFARSKFCDPEGFGGVANPDPTRSFEKSCSIHMFSPEQVGEGAIDLDDNTKWALPKFRKRYMQPESDEGQVLSERYLWEIVKPGSFVTRSKNKEYFLQTEEKRTPQAEDEIKIEIDGIDHEPLPKVLPIKDKKGRN